MAHIELPEGLPGIRGPMAFRPETARPLNELVDVLLRGPHTLSPAEQRVADESDTGFGPTIGGGLDLLVGRQLSLFLIAQGTLWFDDAAFDELGWSGSLVGWQAFLLAAVTARTIARAATSTRVDVTVWCSRSRRSHQRAPTAVPAATVTRASLASSRRP